MKCRICEQTLLDPPIEKGNIDHHLIRSPIFADLCLGCWMFSVQLETFLWRSGVSAIMGDWTTGWMREIIAEPSRYR